MQRRKDFRRFGKKFRNSRKRYRNAYTCRTCNAAKIQPRSTNSPLRSTEMREEIKNSFEFSVFSFEMFNSPGKLKTEN
jgi:transcription elongation factor Elf1